MSVLLQVSDPHFGTERTPVVEALVVLATQLRPDLVVLSGDITQRARADQFGDARAMMDRLGAPLLALPGNHDIALFDLWSRFVRPYARYSAAFGADLAPVFASNDLMVLGVNTTRAWRHKDGEVSSEQIEAVAQRLSKATPEQLRVVVVHQPIDVVRAEDVPNRLHNHTAAQQAWAAAGADLVMGGHIHLPYVMPLPGLARPLWAVQAGTAVSSRVRRNVPNSVNVVRWTPATGCVVEQWDFSAVESAFVCALSTPMQPQRQ
ncbi:metallophosphoesterase [Hydrogenophaga sp.]|uniref:metallophosphoesterase family protein n=1 Tax=Hydrogenophaga sp. TaxID=1904254 RepID=UPI00272F616A|nr:metallophosphoesterase [Hydrogenophaga sp.]MDP2019105.1 metallophosphoesterase [Hydrogenophaga sp.]MDP3167848.1 metallophosphoesterase [Hydrogenophaga sp.]MDP3811569.1 metallophosphoesterase [Hydrogenophaga sp.]